MMSRQLTIATLAAALALSATAHTALARVDVQVEFDKTFNFKNVRTWGWSPEGPGSVKMARTKYDNPEAMQKKAEPIIVNGVTTEMTRLKLQRAETAPDVIVTYYLLLTTNMSAQTIGQFLPATAAWGLPPFAPATQSLQIMDKGSLVIDLSAGGTVVWRGLAQARIEPDADESKRESRLRESVRDLLRRYPPKQ